MVVFYMPDEYYAQVTAIVALHTTPVRPCHSVHVFLSKPNGHVVKVVVRVWGPFAGLLRYMDVDGNSLSEDPVAFDRATRIIETPGTKWALNQHNNLITVNIYKLVESPLEWFTRLYGTAETVLALSHEEADKLANRPGDDQDDEASDNAHAWEMALRSKKENKHETFLYYGGDEKQFLARSALRRCLIEGSDIYRTVWRYLVRDACVNKPVFIRLCVFLGGDEEKADRRFDILIKTCGLTTEELAGIDVLNLQYEGGVKYHRALAWRDMLSGLHVYETYAHYLMVYGESPSEASYASFQTRYATPGISLSDAYSKLWFEVKRHKIALHYDAYQERQVLRRSLGITREADIAPSYDAHYFSRDADDPSLEAAFDMADLDAVETRGEPPFFRAAPGYEFRELGDTPDYVS